MSRRRAFVAAVVLGALVVTAGYGLGAAVAGASGGRIVGPGLVTVHVDIHYSHFRVDAERVRPGTLVRFVVRNHDPIDHEFVIGPPSVHAKHMRGTERTHPPVPGEVSVGPGTTGETVYRFDRVGSVEYACHLPGHMAYGMVGDITVTQ